VHQVGFFTISPETTSILAIENRRENFTGSLSYMPQALSTQMLLNVSGQIVTKKKFGFIYKITKEDL